MSTRIFVLLLAVVLCACNSFPTDEQESRYTTIQKTFIQNKNNFSRLGTSNDTALAMYNDVVALSLDDFIAKHNIGENDLDLMLNSLELTGQLLETFNMLDSKFGEAGDLLKSLDTLGNKIDSMKIKTLDLENIDLVENAKKQSLKSRDTFTLKIMGYDSSYVRKFYKGKEVK